MRVFSFNKVIYDGYLSYDLFAFVIKQRFFRIFKMVNLIPFLVLYILKRIELKRVAEKFYELLLEDLTITELNLFKASNLYKVDLSGFGIVKDNPKDIIVTAEPSFLIDLFINRNKYNVMCTEYNLRNRSIAGGLCVEDVKLQVLKANNITRIQQLYIYTFREKTLMKISDLIFIYRNHELIEYDTYVATLKDKLYYSLVNQKTIIYLGIASILFVGATIFSFLLSFVIEPIQAFLIAYLSWYVVSFLINLTYIDEKNFTTTKLISYSLGILPHFLFSLLLFITFSVIIGFYFWLVMLIVALITLPMLVFVASYYKFD